MKVFKFGGASVKDASSVKNVAAILKLYNKEKLIVVISAMGKTTNALEKLTDAFFYKKNDAKKILEEVKQFHFNILEGLFPAKQHLIYKEIHNVFVELDWAIEDAPTHSYDCEYDQIVSIGEIVSTKIVSAYLNEVGIKNNWLDARDIIKTDNTYREAKVDWEETEKLVREALIPAPSPAGEGSPTLTLTQGFLGCTSENFTTTLGREGSDYTAAILAYCTDAESVTIWKDVPGVLNADPKWFEKTELIPQLSYQDAIELSYYGATVIHPKTIKPLQNKKIPLYVRSFLDPKAAGTVISNAEQQLPVPCFIFKVDQVLVSISPKDFSFIIEENLSDLFRFFSEQRVKVNTMQNSAISFSVCIDKDEKKLPFIIKHLQEKYRVLYNENVELVTIRYYNQATIDRVTAGKKIFAEVKSRYTAQLVMKGK